MRMNGAHGVVRVNAIDISFLTNAVIKARILIAFRLIAFSPCKSVYVYIFKHMLRFKFDLDF